MSIIGPFKGGAAAAAAEHALKYYGGDSRWQVAFDMDEYPLAPADLEPGSLCRAVAAFSATHPDVSELSLKNFVVVGPNDKSVPWIMECRAASRHRGGVVGLVGRSRGVIASHATLPRRRYTRKTKDPMNNLDKPIYRTNAVRKWAFHHNSLKTGRSKDLPPEKLHFNHVRVPRRVPSSSIRHRRDGRDSTPHAVLGRADVRLGRRNPRATACENR